MEKLLEIDYRGLAEVDLRLHLCVSRTKRKLAGFVLQKAFLSFSFMPEFNVCSCQHFQDAGGKDVSLDIYKGKVLLIVNVASKWYAPAALYLDFHLAFTQSS